MTQTQPVGGYPSNSKIESEKDIPEKVKVEKVIQGEAVKKKKGLGSKIAETFTGDDVQSVGEYVVLEVLIPALKSAISDATSQGVDRILFGDTRRRAGGGPRVGGYSGRSYTNYSSQRRTAEPEPIRGREISRQGRTTHNFDEIVLSTRGDAEITLERLNDLVDIYGVATVTDFYDLVGITGSYTDDKWGWTDLRDASFTRVRNGYLLNLPRTVPL